MREEIRSFCEALNINTIDESAVLDSFIHEMSKGLACDESSLAMIPSYISVDSGVPLNEPVIVIDAGGTNLRVCLVTFFDDGNYSIESFSTYSMPGIDKELSKDQFFEAVISYLEPVVSLSNKIGFCFSYPTEITPEKDGRLLYWTKEVKVPELVGKCIGMELNSALINAGYEKKQITILNDTVATLLAGRAKALSDTCGFVGFILGTGINAAYSEANCAIDAIHKNSGMQIINEEAGSFAGMPQNVIDLAFDAGTETPGNHIFEKMISGRYLGSLCLDVLRKAVESDVLSPAVSQVVSSFESLASKDVSDILSGKTLSTLTDDDRIDLCGILEAVVDRAAHLAAIAIAASACKSYGAAESKGNVCITIDGSTFYKLHGLRDRCEKYLELLLSARSVSYQLVCVDDAPVIGSAIAGLCG